MKQKIIHAKVNEALISRADTFFSNRLEDIFIELLQNARRSGATLVTVELADEPNGGTGIIFADNGCGIEDLATLLDLGGSKWSEETKRTEDPAGMGFFALVHSGVHVASKGMEATIRKENFLGKRPVVSTETLTAIQGTKLTFSREEPQQTVNATLWNAAKYGSTDVIINGVKVERKDFLEEALYVKTVRGVRIGVHSEARRIEKNCNFHGRLLDVRLGSVTVKHALPPSTKDSYGRDLLVALDVIEASWLRFKWPDRMVLIEDEAFTAILREARMAVLEYMATLSAHTALFAVYQEARGLGIDLPESVPHYQPFFVRPNDSSLGWNTRFAKESPEETFHLGNVEQCAIIELDDSVQDACAFTFDLAFRDRGVPGDLKAMRTMPGYRGYSWYDSLPVLNEFALLVDGRNTTVDDTGVCDVLTLADTIELSFVIRWGAPSYSIDRIYERVPFAGFQDSDGTATMFVTRDSSWAETKLPSSRPFHLLDAAKHLAFSFDEYGDTLATQESDFERDVDTRIAETLGGLFAVAVLELDRAVDRGITRTLEEAGIKEVRLYQDASGKWLRELVS